MKVLGLLALSLFAPVAQAEKVWVIATAYCGGPCKECGTRGFTRTDRDARLPGIAVDPRVIRLGRKVRLSSKGAWLLADDTGGKIKGRRVDIRMRSHDAARRYGKRRICIEVR